MHTRQFTKHDAHIPISSNNSFINKARTNIKNSKFNSSFNRHTNRLLKTDTASAPQIHITKSRVHSTINSDNNINHIVKSTHESPQINCPTPPNSSGDFPNTVHTQYKHEFQQHPNFFFIGYQGH